MTLLGSPIKIQAIAPTASIKSQIQPEVTE
jgi:hypothetical protein